MMQNFRKEGLRVEIDYDFAGMKSQMKKANKSGASFTIIIGEDEIEKNVVSMKDMETGEQEIIKMEEISKKIKNNVKILEKVLNNFWNRIDSDYLFEEDLLYVPVDKKVSIVLQGNKKEIKKVKDVKTFERKAKHITKELNEVEKLLKDKEFSVEDNLFVHAIEEPLILYYTNGAFTGYDISFKKGRVPLVTYDQKLIILSKRGRYPGKDFLVNNKNNDYFGRQKYENFCLEEENFFRMIKNELDSSRKHNFLFVF
jgi:hypothetical protein